MERKVYVRTIHLLLVISVGLVSLGLGSTYAIFTSSAEIDNPISLSSNLSYDSEIIETVPVDMSKGETKEITLNINNTSGKSLNYVIWKIDYGYNTDIVASEISGCTDTVGMISSSGSCTVKILVRNNVNESIRVIVGVSSSDSSVVLDSSMKIIEKGSLEERKINQIASTYITNLYMNANKSIVTNNEIEYNYATSVSLMNDRLGGTTESLDGGNIRYYGASPNNYIYFNCTDYDSQTQDTCELWRIIGVFDGKVKITRSKKIDQMLKDESGSNNWAKPATLNTYLNDEYYNGLKNDETKNKIVSSTWNLGGISTNSTMYSDQFYAVERGKTVSAAYPATWTGNIALMYPSDYGYAADFQGCNQTLEDYDNINCKNYNWLYLAGNQWLITPFGTRGSFGAYNNGKISMEPVNYDVRGVRPTLYLNTDEVITEGTGEEESPYKLAN